MFRSFNPMQHFNLEVGDLFRVNDVAEKIGSLFGEDGRRIGKAIDNATKDKTIRIDLSAD